VYHLLAYPHHPSSASKRRKKMHRTRMGEFYDKGQEASQSPRGSL